MKHAFLALRKIILKEINGPNSFDKPKIERLLQLKERIIDGIYLHIMADGKPGFIKRRLNHIQKDTCRLLELLFQQEQEKDTAFNSLLKTCLTEILDSLQHHQPSYFDTDQPVPGEVAIDAKAQLTAKIPVLEAAMKNRKINPELQKAVLFPFIHFGENEHNTYAQMKFLIKNGTLLIACLQQAGSHENILLNRLLHMGFNTSDFHDYFKQTIHTAVYTNFQIADQLEVLYTYEKKLRAMSKKPSMRYDRKNEPGRLALLKFVMAEINFLHKKQQLYSVNETATGIGPYRVKTSLSADGLAYLLRLLIECKAIEASPRTALMTFMAAHFQTCGKGSGSLSAYSLGTKYKQVTQHTAMGMKTLLRQMIHSIEHNFSV